MKVVILEARRVVYEESAEKVVLPCYDGEVCIMNFHQPFISRLRKGLIKIDDYFSLPVKDGIARMSGNELVVML
jgi:F0F1-type ATP synthase epsilon subunit